MSRLWTVLLAILTIAVIMGIIQISGWHNINMVQMVSKTQSIPTNVEMRHHDPTSPTSNTIAFLVPIRSMPEWGDVDNIPLLKLFIPSLLTTITPEEFRVFHFRIYLGFDAGDPLYDNEENLKTIVNLAGSLVDPSKIDLKMISFDNVRGKPALIWNRLYEAAFQDGCHYFYQVNDDVRFITPGWSNAFVKALQTNSKFPDLGVVAPLDVNAPILMTQAFVSRIHMHIFRHLYPPLFENWYSDDWLTHVYEDVECADRLVRFKVENTNSFGTRYRIDFSGKDVLEVLLQNGKAAVNEFLQTHVPGPFLGSPPVAKAEGMLIPHQREQSHPASITPRSTHHIDSVQLNT